MQKFTFLEAATKLKDQFIKITDNLESLLSCNSGTFPPTENLRVGMKYFNVNSKKLHTLVSLDPLFWREDDSILAGVAARFYANVAYDGNLDPNLAVVPVMETNHQNSPGLGLIWHITTTFSGAATDNANRTQVAVSRTGDDTLTFSRHCTSLSWSSWEPMTGANSFDPNTLVKRDGAGKITGVGALLLSVASDNASIDGVLTRKTGDAGGVHGSTLAQVKSALNLTTTNWVLKWSGSSTLIGNSWGEGLYLIKVGTDAHVVVECVSGKYCKSPDFAYNGKLTQVTAYIGAFSGYARNAGTTNGAAANIYSIWKAE